MWYSQIFDNTELNGLFLILPEELLSAWDGDDELYDELCEAEGPFEYAPLGEGFGLFLSGPEGDIIHEAQWLRESDPAPLMLAGWNGWDAQRESWLQQQLKRDDLPWQRHPEPISVSSGRLVLVHAEGPAAQTREAPAGRKAVSGERITVSLSPGTYHLETLEIEARPEGEYCVELCRWLPAN